MQKTEKAKKERRRKKMHRNTACYSLAHFIELLKESERGSGERHTDSRQRETERQ